MENYNKKTNNAAWLGAGAAATLALLAGGPIVLALAAMPGGGAVGGLIHSVFSGKEK